jgi:enamine deaminase RidA (YjgF/YER057c/UK114 family)
MALLKDVKGFGMPWEEQYGYAQAVKVDDTIYVPGQLSHDDQGNMVGPAPLDDSGRIRDYSSMETQMRQTYANAKKILSQFGATLENVVEEVLFVTDMRDRSQTRPSRARMSDRHQTTVNWQVDACTVAALL